MSYQPQQNNPQYYGQPGWNVPNQGGEHVYVQDPNAAERGMPKNELGFSDQSIRQAFVRKVFGMVAIMLGVVTVMTAIPHFYTEGGKYPLRQYIQQNFWIYLLSMIAFFVVYFALLCCDGVRRTYPTNIICTGVLTVAIGFMTMCITSYYSVDSVVLAFGITTMTCVSISIFAMFTKRDITSLLGFMFIALCVLCFFGLFIMIWSMFARNIRWAFMVYAALGALIFMVYLAIDIQMIMGGRKFEISPEEHIFAAIMLFMDIIQIFWFILMLFGDRS